MKYGIVTGASKGLGEGIARKMLDEKINLIAVSRNENQELREAAAHAGLQYEFYPCDLGSVTDISKVFNEIAEALYNRKPEAVYLVNNAGVIQPIDIAGALEETAILYNIQVNLAAPVLICNLFLKKAEETGSQLYIANVTSGAAERPVHGWSMYCSTKAAINMFTRTAALELNNRQSTSKVIAYSPGIMDTGMQETIRSSTQDAFIEVGKFREFKEKNMLRSPGEVGEVLVRLLVDGEVENGRVYHVNELL
ncbi:(S)-benzoin forming benzil reductase [Bacillus sp. FJAT-27251]|uniref:(S)-benzoin forming benzil reductase n=1 Tax=Bacillus sp. FJAT-27251 TaxID=1684142 RepID=UPI0006A7E4F2|nr:(S)-benzoin forming benzil reductase [Bacillus sp. FJAT-27251]